MTTDYPMIEASDCGLLVRACSDGRYTITSDSGAALFDDRDIERIRAYLIGYREAQLAAC